MHDDAPNIVYSGESQSFIVDGYRFDIQIYRGEDEAEWLLEVVDSAGTSHAWEDRFRSDKDARHAALNALEEVGAEAFMRGDEQGDVVPFHK